MNRTITVAALAVGLAVGAAHSLKADVKSDEKSLVKFEGGLGKVVSMFGGKAAREGVKTVVAVKGDRKLTMSDTTGQIVDLKEEKVYDLDVKKKTYKVTTFAEIRKQLEDAKRRAQEEASKAKPEAPAPKPAASSKPSEPQYDIDFDIKETGQTRNINGFDTREIVMTITMREKGKTLEQSGGMVLTSDMWMAARIAAMKEVVDFDIRYAKAIAGPILAGASTDDMASAMVMYPMMKDAIGRMRTENVKMDGTPIQTVTTMDAVKSAEQVAAEQKQQQESSSTSSSSSGKGLGGLIGGVAARKMRGNASQQQASSSKATVMTLTNEILKVSTSVDAAELAVPAGFKESK
jgi:hypothetical protein